MRGGSRPSAYVLGSTLNALAVLRCLGRRGIRVRAVCGRNDGMAAWSRYNAPVVVEPSATAEEIIDSLITAARRDGDRPVLIPTGDVDVWFMSQNREILAKHFAFVLSDESLLEALLRKDKFHELAVASDLPVPRTNFAETLEELDELSRRVTYPCVIKPRYSPMWQGADVSKALGYTKVLECWSAKEMVSRYGMLTPGARDVVVQEMIPGNEENLYDVYLYQGPDCQPVAWFCLQKLRTAPIGGKGAGTAVQSIHHRALLDVSVAFLRRIGYRGAAAVCFKRWAGTDRFVAIEVNARLSLHHSLAAHCGIDFAHLLYRDAIGSRLDVVNHGYQAGVKWISILDDAKGIVQYKGAYGGGVWKLLRSYCGHLTFADWAWDDPLPFTRECFALMRAAAAKIWRRATGLYARQRSGSGA